MKIAVTGATGFLGSYVVRHLVSAGHICRCWHRSSSHLGELFDAANKIEWVEGELADDRDQMADFVCGCDVLIHAAVDRPGSSFRGGEGDLETFATRNIVGSLRLFEAAKRENVRRAIFVSSGAVHEKILDDRPLDETHPLWATTHYGAHKAAIEAFVCSMGLGDDFDICSIRPCSIYGMARSIDLSTWFDLVNAVIQGEPVDCQGGGKVVHGANVARAIEILMTASGVKGESFNCCDQYVSHWAVAHLAKELSGSSSVISGQPRTPRHQITTDKIEALGMRFGGEALLRETVSQLVEEIRRQQSELH